MQAFVCALSLYAFAWLWKFLKRNYTDLKSIKPSVTKMHSPIKKYATVIAKANVSCVELFQNLHSTKTVQSLE